MAVPTKLISTSVGFQSPTGAVVALGFLELILSQPCEVTATGGQVTTQRLFLPLDANGKIASQAIWFNDELSPSGTVYYAKLYGSNGLLLIQDFGVWSIVGASADLSFMVPSSPGVSFPPSSTPILTTVAFSATPTFSSSTAAPIQVFVITLTGSVSSSTMTASLPGQIIIFKIIENSAGAWTFAWPTNIRNPQAIDTTANAINVQAFFWDGANANAIGPGV